MYYNGKHTAHASIPVDDPAVLYGEGLFSTIQVREGVPLFLDEHLQRLSQQCSELDLTMPLITHEMIDPIIDQPTGRLRILVTANSLIIFMVPFTPQKGPLRLALSSHPLALVHAQIKTLANLNRLMLLKEAKTRGFDDGISLSPEGYLLEASYGNLCWLHNNILYTPSHDLPLYAGLTLSKVCTLVDHVKYVKVRLEQIPKEANLFRTNTLSGVVPITQIEEREFRIDNSLTEAYERLILETALAGESQHALHAR